MFRMLCTAAAFLPIVLVLPAQARQPATPSARTAPSRDADFGIVRAPVRTRFERDNRNFHIGPTGGIAGDERLLGGFESRAMVVGLGLFRVPRINDADPNRNSPMQDLTGRTQRVAAVGMSLRF